jgi:hypothetical protein
MRPKHPNKEIEAALQEAEAVGWMILKRTVTPGESCAAGLVSVVGARYPSGQRLAMRMFMRGS